LQDDMKLLFLCPKCIAVMDIIKWKKKQKYQDFIKMEMW
jgi:hypothetical protein